MKPIIKEKKAKVKKKKFSWSEFMRYFRTLWKNDACVDVSIVPRKKNNYSGAKFWWVGIPLFLSSIVLAMTPLTVHASKQTGSTAFKQVTYGLDTILFDSLSNEEGNKAYVPVNGSFADITFKDHEAKFEPKSPVAPDETGYYYLGFHKGLNHTTTTKDFDLYFIHNDENSKEFRKIIDAISAKSPVLNSDGNGINKDPDSFEPRKSSYIAFSPKQVNIFIANAGGQGSGQIAGDFKHIKDGSFKDLMLANIEPEAEITKEAIFDNFKVFMDDIFENNRLAIMGAQSGVSLAVNGGVVILLGFIMFFLTRGKQNPNRYIKWYEALNMAMWASFLPGIIALCVGFAFPGMEMMLFLIAFGFRAMWMSMRNLRPQTY